MTADLPILLVDDEAANRDVFSRRLGKRGYKVVTAASGPEALEQLARDAFAAVLLDVQMPGMGGLEVLHQVRLKWSAAEVPVVMVTARDQSEDIVTALEMGANDYITKPIDFPVALARLRTQLARKDAEDRLRASEERYALAARGANDGLWDWDIAAGTVHYSDRWHTIVGLEPGALAPDIDAWFARVHADDLTRVRRALDAHLNGRSSHFEIEHRVQHRSGHFRWVLARALAVRDRHDRPVRMAGSLTDITDGKVIDALTGLPNRMQLHDRLERTLQRHAANGGMQCAALMIDLDGFKLINDGRGQTFGNELLRGVARRLAHSLRASDTVARPGPAPGDPMLARLGGDEFVVLLHDVGGVEDATRVAERLQRAFARPFSVGAHEVFMTASLGVALSRAGSTPDGLLRDADTAMLRARSRGRGRIQVFEVEMRESVIARLDLDTALRLAHERDEFVPFYQPIVDLSTGRLVGFEALMRWRTADGRVVGPGGFVPALEDSGLIVAVGRRFTEKVCRQVRAWRDELPEAPVWVNVNFASLQFAEAELLDTLLATLRETGLAPADLVVEITESAAIGNIDRAAETLGRFRDAGLRVVLDDFGTGYSSLSCLLRTAHLGHQARSVVHRQRATPPGDPARRPGAGRAARSDRDGRRDRDRGAGPAAPRGWGASTHRATCGRPSDAEAARAWMAHGVSSLERQAVPVA
ncbi:MAG: EAL domain-containing protein [Vicinamibacterales bacterium]